MIKLLSSLLSIIATSELFVPLPPHFSLIDPDWSIKNTKAVGDALDISCIYFAPDS